MSAPFGIGPGISIGPGIGFGPDVTLPPPNSVVAYYTAGDTASYPGSGTIWYDLSGQNNHLTLQNSPTWNSAGAASYFATGASGFFNRPSATNLPVGNDPYTFALWINSPGWNSSGMISIGPFGSGNEANAFRTGSYPILINYWWANDLAVSTSAPNTDWFYAVAKFDGTTRSIWVNGVIQGSDTPGSVHNVTNSDLQVGQTLSGEYFNGNIGQVWIYNFAVADSDILANYNATKSTYGL